MSKTKLERLHSPSSTCRPFIFSVAVALAAFRSCKLQRKHNYKNTIIWLSRVILNRKTDEHYQSFPILPYCYGPLRAIDGTHAPYKQSTLLAVRILSTDTKSAGRQTLYHPPLPRKYPKSHQWDEVYRPSAALHGPYASFVIRRIPTDRNISVYMDRYSAGILVNPQRYCIVTVLTFCLNCCRFIIHCYFDFFMKMARTFQLMQTHLCRHWCWDQTDYNKVLIGHFRVAQASVSRRD